MFLKSMFKDFSNDVLIETNKLTIIVEVMFKTKFDSPCMLFTNSTKVYVMRGGVSKKSFLHMCDTFLERTYKGLSNDVRSEVHA